MKDTFRKLSLLAAIVGGFGLCGCAHKEDPKDNTSDYVPVKDRPESAKAYWDKRAEQDKIDRQIEQTRGPDSRQVEVALPDAPGGSGAQDPGARS